jgi:hypothetical protein
VPNSASVQTLTELLSNNQMDQTLFAGYFNFVMATREIARFHTTTASVTYSEATTAVNLPSTLLNLLTLIYDDTMLSDLGLREIESLNPGWRNTIGNPVGFTRQAENVKVVEVFPAPPTANTGLTVYEQFATDCLPYLILPIALLVLEREYLRESDHMDTAFAAMCGTIGRALADLLWRGI